MHESNIGGWALADAVKGLVLGKLPWESQAEPKLLTRTNRTTVSTRYHEKRISKGMPVSQFAVMGGVLLAFVLIAPLLMYQVAYADRVHVGVRSMGVELSGFSAAEAKNALNAQFAKYAQGELVLRYAGKEWRTTPGALGIRFDADGTVQQALGVGRSGNPLEQVVERVGTLRAPKTIIPTLTFDTERQTAVIANLAREVDRPMVNASLLTRPEGEVQMISSQVGRKLDSAATLRRIQEGLNNRSAAPIELVVTETPPRVVEAQLAAARETAERILSGPLTIVHGPDSVTLDREQLTAMLSFRPDGANTIAELDSEAIAGMVTEMAEAINSKPRNAEFTFKSGKVTLVTESVEGQTVDVAASVEAILEGALGTTRIVPLVVEVVPPKVKSSDIANIVIREKLVEASTVYGDTGLDRQHNVKLAVTRLNGTLIPPGGTYSFNKELGPTGIPDGYKYGWGIISTAGGGHETVRSEAGGICQVATTVFHAAFSLGLRIDQRTEHLYWIPRYGKPPLGRTGLDATVDGSGSPDTLDLKFTNTTPNWIAVESHYDPMNIYFSLWGTRTGWTVEIQEPVISKLIKANTAVVRVEDPEIAPGQEVWTEVAQDGFDSSVRRIVRDGGTVIDDHTVKSHYKPAQNVVRFNPTKTPTPSASETPGAEGTPGATGTPGGPSPTATPGATGTAKPAQATPTPKVEPTASPKPQATATPSA